MLVMPVLIYNYIYYMVVRDSSSYRLNGMCPINCKISSSQTPQAAAGKALFNVTLLY